MKCVSLCPNSHDVLWLLKMSTLILGFGLVLFMFGSMYLQEESSLYPVLPSSHPADQMLDSVPPRSDPAVQMSDPVPPHSDPAVQMPKLLPEDRLRSLFSYDGIW